MILLFFGVGVFIFIITTLWFIFRKLIWVIIPLSSCFFSVAVMMGMLGLLEWKVTVISSNFIALMLILTMAMNIHLSTRFLQIKNQTPNMQKVKIVNYATKMFLPILYTGLTTICAFLSLIFSGIKPVVDFGWMMTLGIITSIIVTFTLLPTLINILNEKKIFDLKTNEDSKITKSLSSFTIKNKNFILTFSTLIFLLSVLE